MRKEIVVMMLGLALSGCMAPETVQDEASKAKPAEDAVVRWLNGTASFKVTDPIFFGGSQGTQYATLEYGVHRCLVVVAAGELAQAPPAGVKARFVLEWEPQSALAQELDFKARVYRDIETKKYKTDDGKGDIEERFYPPPELLDETSGPSGHVFEIDPIHLDVDDEFQIVAAASSKTYGLAVYEQVVAVQYHLPYVFPGGALTAFVDTCASA